MRAILVGCGEVDVFEDMQKLVRYVEWPEAESGDYRAFLEDGTEYELLSVKGGYVKRIFSRKYDWIDDFKYTDIRILSAPAVRYEDLRNILASWVKGYLNEEGIDTMSVEELVERIVQQYGYTQ